MFLQSNIFIDLFFHLFLFVLLLFGTYYRCCPYLMRSRRPTAEGCQAGRWISDVGFFRGSGLVPLVGWRSGMVTWLWSPCILTSISRSSTIVLVLVASRWSRAESWLRRPVCKIRASGMSRHVLYLRWTTDRLLLGAKLGGPDLNIEGWLARSRSGGVGCRDRLGSRLVLRLGIRLVLRSCRR